MPEKMSKNFGIAVSGFALPYVVSTGVRDIFMGLVVIILFLSQAWAAMAYCQLSLGFVAIGDFLLVRKYGNKKTSLVHLAGAIIVITYGSFLLV